MHERYVELAKTVQTDILFLGDSITRFMEDTEAWDTYFKPMGALSFGIGGDCTQHILWRIQNGELEPLNPKVIVLLIGTNNVAQGHSAEQVSDGIFTILQYIAKHKAHTKILLLGILPRGRCPCPTRDTVKKINESLMTFPKELSGVDYHDFTSMFISEDGIVSCEDTIDYLHLTRQGYMKLCKTLHEIVTQMMK